MRPSKRYRQGSKRSMYHGIAAAIGCSPTTVERWDCLEGCLQLRLLSYLESRHKLGLLPTKPFKSATDRRWRNPHTSPTP